MVVKLLTLRRLCTEKRSAAELEVGTLLVHFLIYKEVFLLGSYRGANTGRVGVAEQLEYTHSLLVQRLHGAKKRSLFIERLAAVRAECSRNAERLILYECIGGRVPCGVAARLKGRTQTARGKGRSVRLALDELFTRKLHDYAAVGRRGDKAVVFFCRDSGQRLEPMGKVRCALFDRPVLHSLRNCVCNVGFKLGAIVDRLFQRIVDIRRQHCLHYSVVENHRAEIFVYLFHCSFLLGAGHSGIAARPILNYEDTPQRRSARSIISSSSASRRGCPSFRCGYRSSHRIFC